MSIASPNIVGDPNAAVQNMNQSLAQLQQSIMDVQRIRENRRQYNAALEWDMMSSYVESSGLGWNDFAQDHPEQITDFYVRNRLATPAQAQTYVRDIAGGSMAPVEEARYRFAHWEAGAETPQGREYQRVEPKPPSSEGVEPVTPTPDELQGGQNRGQPVQEETPAVVTPAVVTPTDTYTRVNENGTREAVASTQGGFATPEQHTNYLNNFQAEVGSFNPTNMRPDSPGYVEQVARWAAENNVEPREAFSDAFIYRPALPNGVAAGVSNVFAGNITIPSNERQQVMDRSWSLFEEAYNRAAGSQPRNYVDNNWQNGRMSETEIAEVRQAGVPLPASWTAAPSQTVAPTQTVSVEGIEPSILAEADRVWALPATDNFWRQWNQPADQMRTPEQGRQVYQNFHSGNGQNIFRRAYNQGVLSNRSGSQSVEAPATPTSVPETTPLAGTTTTVTTPATRTAPAQETVLPANTVSALTAPEETAPAVAALQEGLKMLESSVEVRRGGPPTWQETEKARLIESAAERVEQFVTGPNGRPVVNQAWLRQRERDNQDWLRRNPDMIPDMLPNLANRMMEDRRLAANVDQFNRTFALQERDMTLREWTAQSDSIYNQIRAQVELRGLELSEQELRMRAAAAELAANVAGIGGGLGALGNDQMTGIVDNMQTLQQQIAGGGLTAPQLAAARASYDAYANALQALIAAATGSTDTRTERWGFLGLGGSNEVLDTDLLSLLTQANGLRAAVPGQQQPAQGGLSTQGDAYYNRINQSQTSR